MQLNCPDHLKPYLMSLQCSFWLIMSYLCHSAHYCILFRQNLIMLILLFQLNLSCAQHLILIKLVDPMLTISLLQVSPQNSVSQLILLRLSVTGLTKLNFCLCFVHSIAIPASLFTPITILVPLK